MSLLVVGLSYRTAPLGLLERAALDADACRELERALCLADHVAEAVVVSTCNRLEVYAQVSRFHAGIAEVGEQLGIGTGVTLGELTDHLYVHYEEAAVAHLFTMVCGLDSMAVGEQQILGQVRSAMRAAQDQGTVGRGLAPVLQQALRVGKRAHAETDLDRAGHSLVGAGLERAVEILGPPGSLRTLVVGAGAMSGLVVATLAKAGVAALTVINRTPERARRLAEQVGGVARPVEELVDALAEADLVVSCTGAIGQVVEVDHVLASGRRSAQVFVDLALPHDVDPRVGDLPQATLVDLEVLGRHLAASREGTDLQEVTALVAEEVEAYLAAQRAEAVAPTVVALRGMARSVLQGELERLMGRLGPIDDKVRAEVEQTLHRVVEKLLHTPTVRMKELAVGPTGTAYADALRELFDLDIASVTAISSVGEAISSVGEAISSAGEGRADALADVLTEAGDVLPRGGGAS